MRRSEELKKKNEQEVERARQDIEDIHDVTHRLWANLAKSIDLRLKMKKLSHVRNPSLTASLKNKTPRVVSMNDTFNVSRLEEAVSRLATTITEVIDFKVKQLALAKIPRGASVCDAIQKISQTEKWVGKKEAAEHLKISLRSLDNWMRKRYIPYIRLGRSVRFKLSEIDETVNRRLRLESRF